jgi:anti-sigma regulatory factor (Ser/Thr protein kinase)
VAHSYGGDLSPGKVVLRLRLYRDRVEACLLDRGIPFVEPPSGGALPISDDVAELAEDGYGLTIARAALDVLEYRRSNHGTNFWHLVKRRGGADGDARS